VVVGHMGMDYIDIVFCNKSAEFTDAAQRRDGSEMFVEVKVENAIEAP